MNGKMSAETLILKLVIEYAAATKDAIVVNKILRAVPALGIQSIVTGKTQSVFQKGKTDWFRGLIYKPFTVSTTTNGETIWRQNNRIHREGDLPAIIYSYGTKTWYRNGRKHRENDLPAITTLDGEKYWYQNNKLHRDGDKPAITLPSGEKQWYQNDRLHRENDQPAITRPDGTKFWFKDGRPHREARDSNGELLPVSIYNSSGTIYGWKNGQFIRIATNL